MRVCLIQTVLPAYRKPVFEALSEQFDDFHAVAGRDYFEPTTSTDPELDAARDTRAIGS